MAMSARLSGEGALVVAGQDLPIRYTLVIALAGRRRSGSGAITSAREVPDTAFSSSNTRLRLEDGTEFRVALKRKIPGGEIMISTLGSAEALKRIASESLHARSALISNGRKPPEAMICESLACVLSESFADSRSPPSTGRLDAAQPAVEWPHAWPRVTRKLAQRRSTLKGLGGAVRVIEVLPTRSTTTARPQVASVPVSPSRNSSAPTKDAPSSSKTQAPRKAGWDGSMSSSIKSPS